MDREFEWHLVSPSIVSYGGRERERCMDFSSLSSFPSVVVRLRAFPLTILYRGSDSVFEYFLHTN